MRLVCMYVDSAYSVFYILKVLNFIGFFKGNFELWGTKLKNINNSVESFGSSFNFTPFDVFWLRLTSKLNILAALKHLPFFTKKWRYVTSLKRHFLKYFSTDFSGILIADVKLMLRKVINISRRYLLPFWAIKKMRRGWQNLSPTPQWGTWYISGIFFMDTSPKLVCNMLHQNNPNCYRRLAARSLEPNGPRVPSPTQAHLGLLVEPYTEWGIRGGGGSIQIVQGHNLQSS